MNAAVKKMRTALPGERDASKFQRVRHHPCSRLHRSVAWRKSNLERTAGGRSSRRTSPFANVARVAQAAADYWDANPVPGTIRESWWALTGVFFRLNSRQWVAEILAGNGFEVVLTPDLRRPPRFLSR